MSTGIVGFMGPFLFALAMFFLFGVECGFVLGWFRGRASSKGDSKSMQ